MKNTTDYQIKIEELNIVQGFNVDSKELQKDGISDEYFLHNRTNLKSLLKKVLKWNNKNVSIENIKFEIYRKYCDNKFYLMIESTDKELDF